MSGSVSAPLALPICHTPAKPVHTAVFAAACAFDASPQCMVISVPAARDGIFTQM